MAPPEASHSFPIPLKRCENRLYGGKTKPLKNKRFSGDERVEGRRYWGWEIGGFGSKKRFLSKNLAR